MYSVMKMENLYLCDFTFESGKYIMRENSSKIKHGLRESENV